MPARKRSEMRQKIEAFLSEIDDAQRRGFSSDQIAKSLEEHGVTISGATLRSYLHRIRTKQKQVPSVNRS